MTQTSNQRLLAYFRAHQADMLAFLTQIVEMESPSTDKPSLDRLAAFLAARAAELNAHTEIVAQETAGNHVIARWGSGRGGTLLLCHMDTVWDLGTLARRPVRQEGDRLFGPGAFDMKGGIVNGLWAIRGLTDLGLLPAGRITMLLTSDEEIGSHSSRALIEAQAVQHDRVFVLEPAQPPHAALKTWRKGTGTFHVTITGRAAHAGAAHEEGINALEELAHQILAIQALTDYAAGTTVSIGTAGGGTRTNVIPDQAWAAVDVRILEDAEADRVQRALAGLQPRLPGAAVRVEGSMNRPPMRRTPDGAALFARAQALAAEIELVITETGTGGASDGNFTAALGVPTLDGLGVAGDGGHALHEHVIVSSLPERAALLAALLRDRD